MANAFTILSGGETIAADARIDGEHVRLSVETVREQLGWELKPEGLCRESTCIPVRDRAALAGDDGLDLAALAALLDRPLALDVGERCAALGTGHAWRAAQMATLEAPDFELPDLDGNLHSLSAHRGKKVLLIAYAAW